MKKILTIVLQAVVVLIGIGGFAFMILEPLFEGRNANATLFQVYFNDLFLAYVYTASIAFFVGIYQAFRALGYVRQDKVFSQETTKALRTIKYCAMTIIGFIIPAVGYLFIVRPGDDIAGGVFMGILITFVSAIVATVAARLEKIFYNDSTKRIKIPIPLSREVLDFVIEAVLKEDQDPKVLYDQVAERYGESALNFDLLMTLLEREGIIETDIYGVKEVESPRYYEVYSRNEIDSANKQEAIEGLMSKNMTLECDRDENLLNAVMKVLTGKSYSFKEIQDELMHLMGGQIEWVTLIIHLLVLNKEGKIAKGFAEREGHYAPCYSVLAS